METFVFMCINISKAAKELEREFLLAEDVVVQILKEQRDAKVFLLYNFFQKRLEFKSI